MSLIREKYMRTLRNATRHTQDFFDESMAKLGVRDLNYERAQQMTNDIKRNVTGSDEPAQGPLDADAKTLLIHDRVINNMHNITMDSENQTLFERLIQILKDGALSLGAAVDPRDLANIMPHKLAFTSHQSVAKMGLAQMLNIVRSVSLSAEQFVGNSYAAVMQFLPIYWNLAESLMTLPLKIPFVYDMWERKFGYD